MFSGIRAVAFDLDGTLYFGNDPAEGAAETVDSVRASGRKVFFVTNNSIKTREAIRSKLSKMGMDCKIEDILTSGYLTAAYARDNGLRKTYVFGSDGLRSEFADAGAETAGEDDAENLVIGLDLGLGYDGIAAAVRVALRADKIIACNRDRVFLGQDRILFPGCAAAVGAVEACCGRSVDAVIGKPGTAALQHIRDSTGARPEEIMMIGDGYDSDVRMACAFGSRSLLIGNMDSTPCIRSVSEIPKLLEE
jgi:HAD superfamily hydrolase (TIGR01450 family)